MTSKKKDRFERMVEKLNQDCDGGCYPIDVVKLLRNEHAWMRRRVRAIYNFAEEMELSKQGFKDLLMDQLEQRRK